VFDIASSEDTIREFPIEEREKSALTGHRVPEIREPSD
jgi:hypothetical protein